MKARTAILLFLSLLMICGSAGAADTKAAAAPAPAPKIKVGDMAPDFKLLDQNGKIVSLSDFRGKKNVALAFYIFAFTGG